MRDFCIEDLTTFKIDMGQLTGVTYGGEHTVEESVTVDALRQSVRIIDTFLDNYPDNVDAAKRRQGMR